MTDSLGWSTELHPHWYRDVSPMRTLILGSFPPHPGKRDYPFFYPNRRNSFWKVLAELARIDLGSGEQGEEFAVEVRYAIMKKLEVGVQNLGLEILRKGSSALDTHIRIVRFHDILSIMEGHAELEKILLPGYSAESSTARSFLRYLRESDIRVPELQKLGPGVSFRAQFDSRSVECVVLNSTSTASRVKYEVILGQFREQIGWAW